MNLEGLFEILLMLLVILNRQYPEILLDMRNLGPRHIAVGVVVSVKEARSRRQDCFIREYPPRLYPNTT